ncbi:MAG: DEAD/DEAH box helicase family protein, partial [Schwartzia sp.]|nr:DEAD/DEAH box helicase family protein [Schwartzia sp. (in: firmicutes)]
MKKKTMFDWTRLSPGFIKAVVYSELTPEYDKPETDLSDKDLLAPYISEIAEWPNPFFIQKYRREIEDYFREAQKGAHLKSIAEHLAKLNYGGFKKNMEPEDILLLLRRKNLTNTVVEAYKVELMKDGLPDFETETTFTKPVTIDITKTAATEVSLYPYQQEAVAELKKFFIDEDKRSGIMMMPTVSGKTMTSAYFLLREMASRGYEIVWLAHRHMLVEQAAEALYRLAPIARERRLTEGDKNTPDELRMVCVSGMHTS